MTTPLDRRRFLTTAGSGIAAGVAVTAGAAQVLAQEAPPAVPVPDADTQAPAATTEPKPVCCDPASTLIFPCSGAADVGEIADHAARKLTKDGAGKMFCLAGVGGRVDGIMQNTKKAQTLLAIDGCPLACARNTLEKAGFTNANSVCLAEIGMVKGQTPPTDAAVAKAVAAGKKALGG